MKEKYEKYFLIGLLILVLVVFIIFLNPLNSLPKTTVSATTQETTNSPDTFSSISSGSTGPGDVSVELTPHKISNGQLVVDIAANTHSVDLNDFDLTKITTLEYQQKTITPVSALSLGGHHSNGQLIFDVDKELDSFTIKIKGIPKVKERVFTWP